MPLENYFDGVRSSLKSSRLEVFWKKVFLNISDIFPCNFIQKDCSADVFLPIVRNFYKHLFCRNLRTAASELLHLFIANISPKWNISWKWNAQGVGGVLAPARKITIKPVLFIENPWNLIRLIFRLQVMKITWSHVSKVMVSSKTFMTPSVTKAKSRNFKSLIFSQFLFSQMIFFIQIIMFSMYLLLL